MLFKVNVVLFTFDDFTGGIISLLKSVVITVKIEIGGTAAQIELRELADKRRLETHTQWVNRGKGANPTVRGIQQLRKNSIQTIRDSADVLRHIIKNVSSRLVGTI
jgi:hypothetical protein